MPGTIYIIEPHVQHVGYVSNDGVIVVPDIEWFNGRRGLK
jgi:hypothetical protein